ncbi:MAG: Uma2 family endonuclease, partial [Bryobacterales bacterium]|nr:Uma2 family endonuclease [Bryobacterales bacterium]
ESAPQPDSFLRLLPSHGGQSSDGNHRFPTGAPELAVEVTVSTSEVDFGRKLALYQRAGVREYVTIEELFSRITWRSMQPDGSYTTIEPDTNDIIRSRVFPGLWLNRKAFWADDGKAMLSTLEAGLVSPEHAEFVRRFA